MQFTNAIYDDTVIKKRSPASYQDRTDDRWFTRPALYHWAKKAQNLLYW